MDSIDEQAADFYCHHGFIKDVRATLESTIPRAASEASGGALGARTAAARLKSAARHRERRSGRDDAQQTETDGDVAVVALL